MEVTRVGGGGLKFRNGFSSSKPPPVAPPHTHLFDNTRRPLLNTHTHCASETPWPQFPRTHDSFSLSCSAPAIAILVSYSSSPRARERPSHIYIYMRRTHLTPTNSLVFYIYNIYTSIYAIRIKYHSVMWYYRTLKYLNNKKKYNHNIIHSRIYLNNYDV